MKPIKIQLTIKCGTGCNFSWEFETRKARALVLWIAKIGALVWGYITHFRGSG